MCCRAVVEGLYSSFSLISTAISYYSRMSIWTSVDVFSQRANAPQTLPMCSLYHIAAMGSHGDAQKAPWVAYGHAQSDSDDRLTANPGRLAVEPLQQFLQQKGCCRGLYSSHSVSHGLTSSTQHSTIYSSTAVLQSTTSTPLLWDCYTVLCDGSDAPRQKCIKSRTLIDTVALVRSRGQNTAERVIDDQTYSVSQSFETALRQTL